MWFQNYYRQWRQIMNERAIPGTESSKSQATRFKSVTNKWAQLLDTNNEVISVSDTNIDLDKDFEQTHQFQHYEREMIQMYKILVSEIFSRGASWIKTLPTKIYPKKNIPTLTICSQTNLTKFSTMKYSKMGQVTI